MRVNFNDQSETWIYSSKTSEKKFLHLYQALEGPIRNFFELLTNGKLEP